MSRNKGFHHGAIIEAATAEFTEHGFMELVRKYTDFAELTNQMINEFVEKIFVHAPNKSTGERIQEVEIYLNFIGHIEVPLPEPTPDEIEDMKKKQYWKDQCRKRKDYELARRKKKNAERLAVEAAKAKAESYSRLKNCDRRSKTHRPRNLPSSHRKP